MRILIVDDSRVCRRLYKRELEKGGYETVEASDGLEALQVIQKMEIALVLLDISMPNMDGYEVCERLRSKEFTTRFHQNKDGLLPVVFVTSNESLEGRLKGFDKGANDFILKGFKPGTLIETVRNVLQPTNPLTGLTVLIVKHPNSEGFSIPNALKEQGAKVLIASDGIQAYKLLCEFPESINFVIAHLETAGLGGDLLCQKVRCELGLKTLPFFMLMSADNRKELANLFEIGITDYVVAPFDKDALFSRMKVSLEILKSLSREIEERKRAEEEMKRSELLAEKQAEVAGLAEFATSVLHNIGNVLNSVYVSCFQLAGQMKRSKLPQMLMAHQIIEENRDRLGEFFSQDQKGKMLPNFLLQCGKKVKSEQANFLREIEDMATKINLMKDIISTQQSYAKGKKDCEHAQLEDIAEEALSVQGQIIQKYEVQIKREYDLNKTVYVQRANLTHVAINLVKNAIEAMRDSDTRILRIRTGSDQTRFFLKVVDSGTGISADNLEKIFSHGFTTKNDGHGFGLSYCFKVIKEMGANLIVESEGEGKGATFSIFFKGPE